MNNIQDVVNRRPKTGSSGHVISYKDMTSLDEMLESRRMRRISIINDGNCLYHAVSHQLRLLGEDVSEFEVRETCVKYLRSNRRLGKVEWMKAIDSNETKSEYLERHSCDREWADDVMLMAAASAFGYVIKLVTLKKNFTVLPNRKLCDEQMVLAKLSDHQYVSVEKDDSTDLNQEFTIFELTPTQRSEPAKVEDNKHNHSFKGHNKHNHSFKGHNKHGQSAKGKQRPEKLAGIMNGPGMGPSEWNEPFLDQQQE